MCFTNVAFGGMVVGIVQTLDVPHKDDLTNAFALVANMGIYTAWGPVQTMTIEIYPTVIRNIGFGTLSLTGRIGAIVGPQLAFLNTYIPGLLYFVCAAISITCVFGTVFLPETMDKNLNDKIKQILDLECTVLDETEVTNTEKHKTESKNDIIKELVACKGKDKRMYLDATNLSKEQQKMNNSNSIHCKITHI